MPDVSILEYGVFAFVAYSSLLMLIISIVKDIPMTQSQSIVRSIYILLGVISMFVIAGMGLNFTGMTQMTITNSTTFNATNDLIVREITNSTTTQSIRLLDYPLWVIGHRMFGLVMSVFFILQMVTLLTKKH